MSLLGHPVAGSPVGEPDGSVPIYAIHGSLDEIVPLGPTRRAIEALRARGASAELVVVHGLAHYDTAMYVGPLREAAEWVEGIWAGE